MPTNKQTKKGFFTDKNGKIVIAQFPSWPLFVAAIFYAIGFLDHPSAIFLSIWGTTIFMLYWSYLEIRYGVNTWRQLLGLLVGGFFLWTIFA